MSRTVWLQGVGEHQAIEAGELRPGMVCCWNYGHRSEVVAVEPSKTGKTVTALLRSRRDGEVRPRRMGAARLVAVEF